MKIAIAEHPVNSQGGLLTWAENMVVGLREIGHDVEHIMLRHTTKVVDSDRDEGQYGHWEPAVSGKIHTLYGWKFDLSHIIPYKGKESLTRTLERLAGYDLVIWNVPVPTRQKCNQGNVVWPLLYKACAKNIGVIHDGNVESYSWVALVEWTGLACVHPCAFKMSYFVPTKRTIILSPHNLEGIGKGRKWGERENSLLSIHTWKFWKRGDKLVRMIPYLKKDVRKVVGGKGIEQYYMSSEDKVKDIYTENGIPIWKTALESGMEYIGPTTTSERDEWMRKMKVFVDYSWSEKYVPYGAHINRTIVEAMINGMVVCTTEMNHLPPLVMHMLPSGSIKEAELIESILHISEGEYYSIVEMNYETIKMFDRKVIAQQMIDLAYGKDTGLYGKLEEGFLPDHTKRMAEIDFSYFEEGI